MPERVLPPPEVGQQQEGADPLPADAAGPEAEQEG